MTNDLFAYKTNDPAAIHAYQEFLREGGALTAARLELSAQVGRRLMVNRKGFGHGTRVTGFERLATDKTGDQVYGGAILITSKTGKRHGIAVPSRSYAGKELQAKLDELMSPDLSIPGMPDTHLYDNNGQFVASSPALFFFQDTLYAQWSTDTAPIDFDVWEPVRLSEYYAAREGLESSVRDHEEAAANNPSSEGEHP